MDLLERGVLPKMPPADEAPVVEERDSNPRLPQVK
jgi:hypothetical protein